MEEEQRGDEMHEKLRKEDGIVDIYVCSSSCSWCRFPYIQSGFWMRKGQSGRVVLQVVHFTIQLF